MRLTSIWWMMMTTPTRSHYHKAPNPLLNPTTDPTHKPCSLLRDLWQGHIQQVTHLGHLKLPSKVNSIHGRELQAILFRTLRDHHNKTSPGPRPVALCKTKSQATVAPFKHHHRR